MKKASFSIFIYILIIGIFILSCKKTGNNSVSGGGNTNNTTLNNGNPSGTYSGFLFTISHPNGTVTVNEGSALFFNSPVSIIPNMNFNGNATVLSVFMNNINFPYNSFGIRYNDSTGSLNFPPAIWKVNGSGTIPSFTFTNNDGLPVYTGISSLPNSITKNQNLVIPLSGISGASQIEVGVSDSLNNSASVNISGSSNTATIPKDSLTKLVACNSGGFYVILRKY